MATAAARALAHLEALDTTTRLLGRIAPGDTPSLGALPGASITALAVILQRRLGAPFLIVTPTATTADTWADDWVYFGGAPAVLFPALESHTDLAAERVDRNAAERLDALQRIARTTARGNPAILAPGVALLQGVPTPDSIDANSLALHTGEALDLRELQSWLEAHGFRRLPRVEEPGDYSLRGGIVDIYHSPSQHPLRVELFGDRVESLRHFSAASQVSVEALESARIVSLLRRESRHAALQPLTDRLPPETVILWVEPQAIAQEARQSLARRDFSHEDLLAAGRRFRGVTLSAFPIAGDDGAENAPLLSIERLRGSLDRLAEELAALPDGHAVDVACDTPGEVSRLREILEERGIAGRAVISQGAPSAGFRVPGAGYTLVTGGDLFQRARQPRASRRALDTAPVAAAVDLEPGDLVVHLNYGFGRFLGMKELVDGDNRREFFLLEYRDATRVYVPVTNIELIQKYVGGNPADIQLDKVGGAGWQKRKAEVQRALRDMADELLRLHARRLTQRHRAYPPDDHWQEEFEASFPHELTPDQRRAVADIKRDMESGRPMDRLLCGDVGFGKTEVAMRAVFKAASAGRQVAVLAPTTVLADQHLRTFSERMREYPLTIGGFSRFQAPADIRRGLKQLEAGALDIAIGTHRLLSADVKFDRLGLLIVDEEQRFGVAAKEKLRHWKDVVDVLSLSATPIPRTIHQSMVGIKDISNLATPPPNRLTIHTEILRTDERRVRQALLHELERGGQAFFVHNRVQDIEDVAGRLHRLVPEARLGVGHGQMPPGELEDVMTRFLAGEFDVLVATTIIESGLDMPRVNTLFVNNADHFGLADLHQLRGRVGRDRRRAYAYFMVPPERVIPDMAMQRLRAIAEYNELGAGFKIAMRDLEIRGAGNLLGPQQSGHIRTVGYDLYCKLLRRAVEAARRAAGGATAADAAADYEDALAGFQFDVHVDTMIPLTYIPDAAQRLEILRKLAAIRGADDAKRLRAELRDRFGPPHSTVENLILIARIQHQAVTAGIHGIVLEDGNLLFHVRNFAKAESVFTPVRDRCKILSDSTVLLYLRGERGQPARLLGLLKKLLAIA